MKDSVLPLAVLFTGLISSAITTAQNCSNSIAATSPSARFTANQSLITDQKSGLVWQRCSEGQTWQQNKCQGKAKLFTLAQAHRYIDERRGWRLPTIKELAGIVELHCAHPAINLGLFPNTANQHYWSATQFATDPTMHWQVQFATGDSQNVKDSTPAALRLISVSLGISVHTSPGIGSPASVPSLM